MLILRKTQKHNSEAIYLILYRPSSRHKVKEGMESFSQWDDIRHHYNFILVFLWINVEFWVLLYKALFANICNLLYNFIISSQSLDP